MLWWDKKTVFYGLALRVEQIKRQTDVFIYNRYAQAHSVERRRFESVLYSF